MVILIPTPYKLFQTNAQNITTTKAVANCVTITKNIISTHPEYFINILYKNFLTKLLHLTKIILTHFLVCLALPMPVVECNRLISDCVIAFAASWCKISARYKNKIHHVTRTRVALIISFTFAFFSFLSTIFLKYFFCRLLSFFLFFGGFPSSVSDNFRVLAGNSNTFVSSSCMPPPPFLPWLVARQVLAFQLNPFRLPMSRRHGHDTHRRECAVDDAMDISTTTMTSKYLIVFYFYQI